MGNRQLQAQYDEDKQAFAEQQLADDEANAPRLQQEQTFTSFEDLWYQEFRARKEFCDKPDEDGLVETVDLNKV